MSQEEIVVPKGWEMKTLSQVCTINPSKSEIKDLSDDTLVSFIPMRNVDDKQGVIQTWGEEVLGKVRKGFTYFRNNDVIFAKITPCMENGKIAIGMDLKNGIGFGSTEFHVLRPHDQILSGFIHYFLRNLSFRMEAKENFTGSAGQQRVPKDFLENYIIPVPPILIQKKIVAKLDHILGELDTKKKEILSLIEQNKERIDFFEKNWMSYVIDREIEKHSQKNKWDLIQLEQISKIIDSLHETPQYSKEGIPMVRSTEIKAGNLNLQTALLVSKEIYEKFTARYKPKRNDIVMSRVGTYFVTSFVNTDDAFCMGQNTLIIHPLINPEFLYFYLNSKSVEKQIQEKLVGSSGQKTLSLKHIRSLLLVSPSLLIQKQIVQNIKSAEEKFQTQKKKFENIKNNYESKINYINHIQSSVLDSAFSGKLIQ